MNGNVNIINSVFSNDGYEIMGPPNGWEDFIGVSTVNISNSNIQNGQEGIESFDNMTLNWLEGNQNLDPDFVDLSANDYHLSKYSSLIGAGIDSIQINNVWYHSPLNDIEGNPRPNPAGSTPDIGAYENSLSVRVVPTSVPTGLTAIPRNEAVSLIWNQNTESDFAKYIIYGGISTSPTTKVDSTTSIDDTTKTITSLTNGTTYYYRITAVDTDGNESKYSIEITVTPWKVLKIVKKDGTGDYTTIQAGINAAVDGDTLLVYEGTYVENIIFNGKSIVVGSEILLDADTSHISRTIIDGNQFDSVVIMNY
ncbi:MAG: hypothetical protein KAK01_04170, partial [Candidatus Marinimicrobia bacterium]|nr:hypothetical protein [Candidatus Neomarinimicrobiota bacterium]